MMNYKIQDEKKFEDNDFLNWKKRWKERTLNNNKQNEKSIDLMKKRNPVVIPRNHKVEEALFEANQNNLEPFKKLLKVLKDPYNKKDDISEFQSPSKTNVKYQTFCGT